MERTSTEVTRASRTVVWLALVMVTSLWLGCDPQRKADGLAYHGQTEPTDRATKPELDARIEFLEKRLKGRSQAFLEQAELASLYLQKGKLRNRPRELQLAETWLHRSLQSFPNNPARVVQADLWQMEHKFDQAVRTLERVLKEEPDNLEARALAVRALLAQGKSEEADRFLTPMKKQPFFAVSLLEGQVLEARGFLDDAAQAYQKAIARESVSGTPTESARVRAIWARMERIRGKLELANRLLFHARAIPVDLPLVEIESARLDKTQGNLEKAEKTLRSAFARYQDPTFLLELALIQKEQGQTVQAKSTAFATVELLRKHPFGHERDLARALLELDPQAHKKEIVRLMAAELRRRHDEPTLETLTEVERVLGPLPEVQRPAASANLIAPTSSTTP